METHWLALDNGGDDAAQLIFCNSEKAEEAFRKMATKFANFPARIEFARFFIETGRSLEAKETLKAIIDEYAGMESYEKKLKKDIVNQAKRLLHSIK